MVLDPRLRVDITEGEPGRKGDEKAHIFDTSDLTNASRRIQRETGEILEMPAYEGPENIPAETLKTLEAGNYHVGGILEDFGVRWDREKCARDIWQNFFDANGQSLDKVNAAVTQEGNEYLIKIEGLGIYDPRMLLHVGATIKANDEKAAGGFGEGTAVSSFVILKDFGASEIDFESVGWNMKFALKEMPIGSTTKRQRGLFAQLTPNPTREEGNSITIRSRDKELAEAIVNAKDLFYHSGNEDFKNATFNNTFGGLRILEKTDTKKYTDPTGHLYDAGQRRHYEDDSNWDKLEWMHLWTWEKSLPRDRDRGKANRREVNELMITRFIDSLSIEDCESLLYKVDSIWDKAQYYTPAGHLVKNSANA